MPYAKKSKRRSYSSRLRDKRINTIFEKRAKEIAQKEDRKNMKWYVDKHIIAPAITDFPEMGAAPSDLTKMIGLDIAGGMYHEYISTPGNSVVNPGTSIGTFDKIKRTFTCRTRCVQCNLRFINSDQYMRTVRVALAYVPNLSVATLVGTAPLRPQRWWLGDTNSKFKGIFKREQKYLAQGTAYEPQDVGDPMPTAKVRILAQKLIKLPAAHIYDVKGATAIDDIGLNYKEVNLSHYYKGDGKKDSFYYNTNTTDATGTMLTSGNFVLLVASDQPDQGSGSRPKVFMYGVAGIKFRLISTPLNIRNQV